MQAKVFAAIAGGAVLAAAAWLTFITTIPAASADDNRPVTVLYVSNFNSNEITAYDARSGEFLGVIVKAGSELSGANGITVGADGDLYVAGQNSNNVLRYDGENGRFKGALDTSNEAGLSSPQGVEFGPDGLLYAASYDNDKLVRFDTRTHKYAGTLCETKLPGVQHMGPIHPVFGNDNNLYIGTFDGHRALKFQGPLPPGPGAAPALFAATIAAAVPQPGALLTIFPVPPSTSTASAVSDPMTRTAAAPDATVAYASGTLADASAPPAAVASFGTASSAKSARPAATSAPTAAQHYFVDFINSATFTGQVLEYTAEGEFVKSFVPNGTGGLVLPGGIGIGPDKNLYVANIKVDQNFQDIGSEILRFDKETGEFLGTLVKAGKGLNVPFAMAFATRSRPLRGHGRRD